MIRAVNFELPDYLSEKTAVHSHELFEFLSGSNPHCRG